MNFPENQMITVTELQRNPVGVRNKLKKLGILYVFCNNEFLFSMMSKDFVEENK